MRIIVTFLWMIVTYYILMRGYRIWVLHELIDVVSIHRVVLVEMQKMYCAGVVWLFLSIILRRQKSKHYRSRSEGQLFSQHQQALISQAIKQQHE